MPKPSLPTEEARADEPNCWWPFRWNGAEKGSLRSRSERNAASRSSRRRCLNRSVRDRPRPRKRANEQTGRRVASMLPMFEGSTPFTLVGAYESNRRCRV